MRDDDREFEQIARDSWGAARSPLPCTNRYWPWTACPLVLALVVAATLYPITVTACGHALEQLTMVWEDLVRACAFLVSGVPGVLDGSAPGWHRPLLRPPLYAQQELAAALCALFGAMIADVGGEVLPRFLPRWTAAYRGYASGLRLSRVLPWAGALWALVMLLRGTA